MKKKAVLVVSFGTSYPDALKNCLEKTENSIYQALPTFEPRRAFTSEVIIRKLAKRDGVRIENTTEALEKLKREGFKNVVVQPLHILPGYEYHKIYAAIVKESENKVFKNLRLGEPLLYNAGDYTAVTEALKEERLKGNSGITCVFMGHGTSHFSNTGYYCLQSYMHNAGLNAYIANVEGPPTLAEIIKKLKQKTSKKVLLMPFMLVAGDHVKNDMARESNSWKTILEDEGFAVTVHRHGLGEKEAFRQIYAGKALKAAGAVRYST